MRSSGTLFVISAPSGAGKTTLCRKLLNNHRELQLSVSYTTRKPRKGEADNVDYTFVDKDTFLAMKEKGEFAEWAMVHGNLYGTSMKRLKELNREGYDIILDIDTRGAMQIKKCYDNAVYIFILPPSLEVLEKRLLQRKTDSADVIARRLDNARAEIAYYKDYDYIVVNDELDRAYGELESIFTASKLRTAHADPEWIKKLSQ